VGVIGNEPGGGAAPATTQGAPEGATSPGTTAAPETAAPEGGGFDYSRIESMLDQRFGQMDERVGGLESRLPEPQAPPEPQPQDPFGQLGELGYDDGEIQALQGVLAPLFQNVVQQAQAPLLQQLQMLQQGYAALNNELDAGDLVERYPALGTDEVYTPVAQQALQLAQSLGLQVQNPEEVPAPLVEQVYLAQLGRERVASETPAGGGNPGLETAGGATPPEPEPDLAKSIVAARGGQRTAASDFWGWTG
jgi:hypothetical protein